MNKEDQDYLMSQRLTTILAMSVGLICTGYFMFKEYYISSIICMIFTIIFTSWCFAFDDKVKERLDARGEE